VSGCFQLEKQNVERKIFEAKITESAYRTLWPFFSFYGTGKGRMVSRNADVIRLPALAGSQPKKSKA